MEELTEGDDVNCPTINDIWRGMIKKKKRKFLSRKKQISGLILEGYSYVPRKGICLVMKGS